METTFWRRFTALCKEKGVTPHKVMIDNGLNTANPAQWRQKDRIPSMKTLKILSAYFGVSVDDLLTEQTEKAPASEETGANEDELRFALFGGEEVSDETWEKVKTFALFAAEEERRRKERGIDD